MNDEDYMRMVLELAGKAAGKVSPDPMVGAVVVKDGEVVGRGFYEKYGSLEETFEAEGAETFVAEIFDQWNVIYRRGHAVAGVVNAARRETAVAFVQALIEEAPETIEEYGY